MATNTAATSAREYQTHQVHYLRKAISYADGNGKVYTLGYLPAGSTVIDGGVVVTTAFNAGTTNTLDIGVTGTATGFASAIALGTVGRILADDMATTTKSYSSADIAAIATLNMTGTAATTGAGYAYVAFMVADGSN